MTRWQSSDLNKPRKPPSADRLSPSEYQAQYGKPKAAKPAKWGQFKQSESEQQAEGVRLDIKPASVNDVFKGQRFRNEYYNQYERDLLNLLPRLTLPPPPFRIDIVFGFSSTASDIDNPCKPFLDVISKAYGFNDKLITELHIRKELTAKGQEYITFNIKTAA